MCDKCNKPDPCNCNNPELCGCATPLDLTCLYYTGQTLETLGITEGMGGEIIIEKINNYLRDIIQNLDISPTIIENVGSGIKIHKGLSNEFVDELRTLKGIEGISISESENEISINVDTQWLENQVLDTIKSSGIISTIAIKFSSVESKPGTPTTQPTNWTTNPGVSNVWMAIKEVSGGSILPWRVIKTRGVDGKDGKDGRSGDDGIGVDGQSTFQSHVFRRFSVQPPTPVGGSYFDAIPAGWSDGIPPEDGNPAWMSSRTFTDDGLAPQQDEWSTPGLTTDTATIDYEYSAFTGTNPGTPSNPLNGATWHNTGVHQDIWQAFRTKSNGVFGPWSVIKIKGEQGEQGESGTGFSVVSSNPIQSVAVGSDSTTSSNLTYLVVIDVFVNSTLLEATNNAVLTDTQYRIELPTSPHLGISVVKSTPNTLKYTVASGTVFPDKTITSLISIKARSSNTVLKSSFVLLPIRTAEDATSLTLTTDSNVVRVDTFGAVVTPLSITATANQQNYSEVITWSSEPEGIVTGIGATKTISPYDLFQGTHNSVKIKVSTPNGLVDETTIVKVQDGEQGIPGESGISYSVLSSNPLESVAVGSNNILDVARTFDVSITAFKNGEALTATNWPLLESDEYRVEIPIDLVPGITATKFNTNTIRIFVAAGTSLSEAYSILINAIIGTEKTVLGSSFHIVPIPTAEDSLSLSLVSNTVVVKYDSTGKLITTEAIELDVNQQNYRETVTWSTEPVVTGLHGTTGLKKIIDPATLMGQNKRVNIRVSTPNGLFDETSIVKVQDGENGVSTYMWVKYATGPNGEDMSEYPVVGNLVMSYIGLATNKSTPIESNNPLDYTWSKYQGDQGIPGKNGYLWLKYSEYPLGRDTNGDVSMKDSAFNIDPSGEKEYLLYMGIAYNKNVQTESNIPEDYSWSRVRGEDGHTNYILDLSNDNTSVPATSEGTFTNPAVAFENAQTTATLYYGNEPVDSTEWGLVLTSTPELTFTANTDKTQVRVTGLTTDTGTVTFTAHPKVGGVLNTTKKLSVATFSISKVRNTAVHEIVPSTNSISVSSLGTIRPATVSAKILRNSGDTNSYTNQGDLTYRYLFESNINIEDDGTPIGIGTSHTISNAGNPLFLEFKYFHSETGELVDRERIPFVRDGQATNYEETRFAKTSGDNIIPEYISGNVNPGANWTVAPPQISLTEVLWVIKATKKSLDNSLVGVWSAPVRWSGPAGKDGQDGESGYSVISNNPLETLAVGSDNIVGATTNFEVTFAGYKGATLLEATNNSTRTGLQYFVQLPTGLKSGVTVTKVNPSTLRFTINSGTSFGTSSEAIPVVIKMGATNLDLIQSFTIVPINTAEDAYSLRLNSDSLVVRFSSAGTLVGPSSIVLTAVQQNYSETIAWSSTPAGIVTGTGNVKTLNSTNLFSGGNTSVKVKVETSNGLFDELTIVKVQDGVGGTDGTDGKDGKDGITGTTGLSPRTFEWLAGATYQNGGGYLDYIYYRGNTALETDPTRGWYTVKAVAGQNPTTAVANTTGAPNSAFVKAAFQQDMTFGTVIAEQANLAGFLFRNQKLESQASSPMICGGVQTTHPNLSLDGIQGIIKFLDRMVMDKSGIVLKDDCGRKRMRFQWDESGVPKLEFLDENSNIIWSAGQGGYIYITTGTRPATWGRVIRLVKIDALANKPINIPTEPYPEINEIVLSGQLGTDVLNEAHNKIFKLLQLSCSGPASEETPYKAIYGLNSFSGPIEVKLYTKGDMSEDINNYNAYYLSSSSPVKISEIGSAPVGTFAPNGWYFMEGFSGENLNNSSACSSTKGVYPLQKKFIDYSNENNRIYGYYITNFVYMENGNIKKTVSIVDEANWAKK